RSDRRYGRLGRRHPPNLPEAAGGVNENARCASRGVYSPAMDQEKIEAPRWARARRVGFRFLFTYLVLFGVPTFVDTLDVVPVTAAVNEAYKRLLRAVLAWV